MSVKIFISYSDVDRNKMDAFRKALKKIENKFTPIVVARKPTPSQPLSEKVKKSILESSFIVPILTKNSIYTQWVNQEIGFAIGRDKSIIPIVEKSTIGNLKGFINNQLDLPFNFEGHSNKKIEASNFNKCYKLLIEYLENSLVKYFKSKVTPKKIKQGAVYKTTVIFKGNLINGFFDNYVEHLESSFRLYHWDTTTLNSSNPIKGGNLNGEIDIKRTYEYQIVNWPLGLYKIHVRVYEHPVVGKRGRYFIAEDIHQVQIIEGITLGSTGF